MQDLVPRSRLADVVVAIVRVLFAGLWMQNVVWKIPPDFGADHHNGLWHWAHLAVTHPVFRPYTTLVETVILPGLPFFGWIVVLVEGGLGAFLLVGLATRLWALIGVLQTVVILLSALNAPGEWPWSYYLMALTSAMLWVTAAGRSWGVDAVLRPRVAGSTGRLARLYRSLS